MLADSDLDLLRDVIAARSMVLDPELDELFAELLDGGCRTEIAMRCTALVELIRAGFDLEDAALRLGISYPQVKRDLARVLRVRGLESTLRVVRGGEADERRAA
jgi:DNA-binding CsgD family transcriptional regulator